MIELDLVKLQGCLIWELKILAAVRRMCVDHGIDVTWCTNQEQETAKLHEQLRKVVKMRGEILVVKPKR